jgi:DNA-binding CsgD family transcriptional regulator
MIELRCKEVGNAISDLYELIGWDDFLYIFSTNAEWGEMGSSVVVEASLRARQFYCQYQDQYFGNTLFRYNTARSDLPQVISLSEYISPPTDPELVRLLLKIKWKNGLFWPTYGYGGALGYLALFSRNEVLSESFIDNTLNQFHPLVSQFNAWSRCRIEKENKPMSLSPRQTQCLLMVSEGKTSKEIARHLSLAPRTVEYHIQNAMQKLEVSTRSQAVSKISAINPAHLLRISRSTRENKSSGPVL